MKVALPGDRLPDPSLNLRPSFCGLRPSVRHVQLISTDLQGLTRIVSPIFELLVQFFGTASNPFVIAAPIAIGFLWWRPDAVRLGTILIAALFGLLDAIGSGLIVWGFVLVAVSGLAGALIAEIAFALFFPLALLSLGYARSLLVWFKCLL